MPEYSTTCNLKLLRNCGYEHQNDKPVNITESHIHFGKRHMFKITVLRIVCMYTVPDVPQKLQHLFVYVSDIYTTL